MIISEKKWVAAGVLLATAGFASGAFRLASWTFDGPGPGLFPQAVAVVAVALALVNLVLPRFGAASDEVDGDESDGVAGPEETRTALIYSLGLIWLVAGTFYAGFSVTVFVLMAGIIRFAERRSWLAAVIAAAAVTIVGLVGFGWALGVNLPEGPIDTTVLAYLRAGAFR